MDSMKQPRSFSRRAKIAAAVGTAAAAVAASVVAVKKARSNERADRVTTCVLRVKPHHEGWALFVADNKAPARTFEVKSDAVTTAREVARRNIPSELIIHRADGSTQSKHQYTQ